jgi:hypothetical protein
MTGHFSYRVYNSDHSQSIAPTSFRTAPRKKERGLFGFVVLTLIVVGLIGGAGFAGQRMLDAELAGSPRLAQGGAPGAPAAPFAMSLTAPTVSPPAPAVVTPVSAPTAAAAAESPPSRLRRKVQHRRPAAPPSSASSGALPSERGAVPSPTPPSEPPPNPF